MIFGLRLFWPPPPFIIFLHSSTTAVDGVDDHMLRQGAGLQALVVRCLSEGGRCDSEEEASASSSMGVAWDGGGAGVVVADPSFTGAPETTTGSIWGSSASRPPSWSSSCDRSSPILRLDACGGMGRHHGDDTGSTRWMRCEGREDEARPRPRVWRRRDAGQGERMMGRGREMADMLDLKTWRAQRGWRSRGVLGRGEAGELGVDGALGGERRGRHPRAGEDQPESTVAAKLALAVVERSAPWVRGDRHGWNGAVGEAQIVGEGAMGEAIESGVGVVGARPCDEERRERIARQNLAHVCGRLQ
jgi:hypothetical protein